MGKISLEFTTTACSRPAIVDKTYSSFVKYLKGVDFGLSTLYLNVDPVPEHKNPMLVVNVAKKYFGNVIYNLPDTPGFGVAIKWCWEQPKSDKFFYLQDDWEMRIPVRIDKLVRKLGKTVVGRNWKYGKNGEKKIVSVILRAYKKISDNRICLSPSLVDNDWAKDFISKMNVELNPEKQTRPKGEQAPFGGILNDVYCGFQYPIKKVAVRDIGRSWMKKHGFARNHKKGRWFIGWRKIDEKQWKKG